VPGAEGRPVCFGTTGAIMRVDPATGRTRSVTGLPSLGEAGGANSIGPSDIAFAPDGRVYLTIGLGLNPAVRAQLPPAGAGMASLNLVRKTDGAVREIADLGAFEAANNPDGSFPGTGPDTDPNAVDASGKTPVVVDAGGNDVLSVRRNGSISVLAVIPFGTAQAPPGGPVPPGTTIPVQSVPTSIVRGPDGALYVGQLTGFPFPVGGASVWRIVPGQRPKVYATGYTQITGLAFDGKKRLCVTEYATQPIAGPPSPGALICGKPHGRRVDVSGGRLHQAFGLTIRGRWAYLSNNGGQAGTGELVRVSLNSHR
jgi:hypothetical protein